MKKIKSPISKRKQKIIRKIIVMIIILIILGLILTAAFGNLDAIKILWKTP